MPVVSLKLKKKKKSLEVTFCQQAPRCKALPQDSSSGHLSATGGLHHSEKSPQATQKSYVGALIFVCSLKQNPMLLKDNFYSS